MSVPTAAMATAAAAAAIPVLNPFDAFVLSLNSNPYFIGLMMLLLNLGGRFIAMEVTKGQEQFFQNPWVRRLLIFTVLFVGTRNVMVAFWSTLVIILLIGYLFNENSSLCIFNLGGEGSSCADEQQKGKEKKDGGQPNGQVGFTFEEAEIYRRLTEKYNKFMKGKEEASKPAAEKAPVDIYWQNLNLLAKAEGFYGNPRF
jgi:hypothetical protein